MKTGDRTVHTLMYENDDTSSLQVSRICMFITIFFCTTKWMPLYQLITNVTRQHTHAASQYCHVHTNSQNSSIKKMKLNIHLNIKNKQKC